MLEPTLLNYIIAATCAILLGISKSGIKGIASLIVTGLALVYGAKNSTGILMPLLLVGDVFAISYYKRHVQKEYIIKLNLFIKMFKKNSKTSFWGLRQITV